MVTSKPPQTTPTEELKKLRFAELDAAYTKQLKALSHLMRSTRIGLNKLKSQH